MIEFETVAEPEFIRRGSADFRRVNLALLAAGFATFALMYSVQPLLPLFSAAFHLTAAQSSLALSTTSFVLAAAMLFASSLSEALGRKNVMLAAMSLAATLTLLSAAAPGWHSLLALRALEGLAFSGLPAVAMAYVGEEVHPDSAGHAMGLYISGSAFGGMAGRVLAGLISDVAGWRAAMASIGLLGLAAALVFWRLLPPSRHFVARPMHARRLAESFQRHLMDKRLRPLFAMGFLLMGGFVAMYNYFAYRLLAPPFALSQAVVGLISTIYLAGIVSSTVIGKLGDRFGRRALLAPVTLAMLGGTLLTLPDRLPIILLGLVVMTAAFFGAHALASTGVARTARQAPAQASSLYLFSYYMGASIAGTGGGLAYHHAGWIGVVALVDTLLAVAAVIAWLKVA